MSKVYTNQSNCIRAAKTALGKTTKRDVDFTIAGSGKEWRWTAKAKALPKPSKAPRAKGEPKPRGARKLAEQPQMAKLIAYFETNAADGVSVSEAAKHIGCNKDTLRGMVSRLNAAGAGITKGRPFKETRYYPKGRQP